MYSAIDENTGFPPCGFSDWMEEWWWEVMLLFIFVNHQFLDLVSGNTEYSDFFKILWHLHFSVCMLYLSIKLQNIVYIK